MNTSLAGNEPEVNYVSEFLNQIIIDLSAALSTAKDLPEVKVAYNKLTSKNLMFGSDELKEILAYIEVRFENLGDLSIDYEKYSVNFLMTKGVEGKVVITDLADESLNGVSATYSRIGHDPEDLIQHVYFKDGDTLQKKMSDIGDMLGRALEIYSVEVADEALEDYLCTEELNTNKMKVRK